jgi:hypothetical protein
MGYCRTLTDEEWEAAEAHQARHARKVSYQRDRYFARLKAEV